jgi:membrane associated rhomboid family serine protease
LYLNIGVFVTISIVNAFVGLFTGHIGLGHQWAADWLGMPTDGLKLITRPWTVMTYMFTHLGFYHLLFNMLVLYFSGKILMEYLGQRRLLALYIYGGLGGGLLYLIISNISPILGGSQLVGASAGTMAILVAGALYMPTMELRLWGILPVKYWILAAGVIFLDIISLTGTNAGGHLAHLGGALVAYFFIESMRKGHEWNVYLFQVIDAVRGLLFRGGKKKRGFSFGEQTYKRSTNKSRNPLDSTRSGKSDQTSRMDEILDKIKAKGYESLSKEEKEFLFKISKD